MSNLEDTKRVKARKLIIAVNEFYQDGPGAPSRFIDFQARGLSPLGYHVDIIASKGHWAGKRRISDSITATCLRRGMFVCSTRRERIFHRISYYHWIFRILLAILFSRPDVVFFYGPSIGFALLVPVARLLGMQTFYFDCDLGKLQYLPDDDSPKDIAAGHTWLSRLWIRIQIKAVGSMASNATYAILGGTTLLESLYRRVAPRARIVRLYPPTDTQLFNTGDGEAFRKKHNLGSRLIIAYAGSLVMNEGVHILLKSFAMIRNRLPNAFLVIAGITTHLLNKSIDLKMLAADLDISGSVLFTGLIPLQEITDLYAAADVLVNPKIDHLANRVASPIKIGEYLASGKPMVSSRICELDEILVDGEEAIFFEPENVDELANCLTEILQATPQRREDMGKRAQEAARKNFDYRTWALRIHQMIEMNLISKATQQDSIL
jgi:glycosyltransferase involved in cell wall biosynthesis